MRHYKKGRKLGTDKSHTKAMKKSLVCALFTNDRIKTIDVRAKEIRPDVDKIITWAKKGDLHSRRLAIAAMGDKELVREVFEKVAQGMFADRNGGYTRIIRLGNRKGDNAPMVIMELVTEPAKKKTADKGAAAGAGAKKTASGGKSAASGAKSAGAGSKKAAGKKADEGAEAEGSKAEAAEEAAEEAVEETAAEEAVAEEATEEAAPEAEAEAEAAPEAEAAADDAAAGAEAEAAAKDEQKDEAAE